VTALLVLVAVSVIGPLVAARLRVPGAVVLILAGVGVGPLALGWVRDGGNVAFTAELGFLILMFIAGLEIDFEDLRIAGPRALVAPVLTAAGSLAGAVALGVGLHLPIPRILVLSATSLGMPIAVLQETSTLKSPVGRHVLLTASIGEFLSILAITGWQVTVRVGFGRGLVREAALVLVAFAVSALAIRWARALVWWHPKAFERTAQDHASAEIGVRTGLLVMLAFVMFMRLFGIEAILGAFLAGTLVGFVLREKHSLEKKVATLGHGLFIPVFFTVVGVRFDPRTLDVPAVRQSAMLVGLAFAVKIVPALLFAPRALSLRARLAAGALLAAPLTLVVAIGAVGRELGAIDAKEAAAYVLVALVLSTVFPAMYRVLAPRPTAPQASS
jgi:Kef-type K+ transport system membrane component KefB